MTDNATPEPGQAPKGLGATLTDGTGISPLTGSKFLKDAVLDFLLALPAALLVAGVTDLPQDEKGFMVAGFAIVGVAVKAAYRAALRWANTPS